MQGVVRIGASRGAKVEGDPGSSKQLPGGSVGWTEKLGTNCGDSPHVPVGLIVPKLPLGLQLLIQD